MTSSIRLAAEDETLLERAAADCASRRAGVQLPRENV